MKKVLQLALPLAVLGLAIVIAIGINATAPKPEKDDSKARIAALNVVPAERENITLMVKSQGEVRARTDINLVPEVSGRIIKVSDVFAEGGAFTPDTVLAEIDPANFKLAVVRAEARVAEARVRVEQELADARIKEKQWRDWVKDGEPTPLALNKPQVAQAQASLRAAQADLDEAKLNLDRTKIRLPFHGRVAERMIGLGQYVTPGTNLGRVFATDVVEVRLPLTDRQMGELNLAVGFDAQVTGTLIPVKLTAQMGGRNASWDAKIVRTQASIDQATRLYYAIAQVENPYAFDALKPALPVGLFVNAEITSANSMDAVVIPRTALRGDDKVFIVEDDKMLIRSVNVLSTNSRQAVLAGGIYAGDVVVTSPVRSAVDGMAVSVVTSTAAKSDDTTAVVTASTASR